MSQEPTPRPARRVLNVLAKSLMAEILPDPTQAQNAVDGPRARVLKRLLQIAERAAAVGAAASLSGACADTHSADQPNGQGGRGTGGITATGGNGNTGGSGGYVVVDPLPPPRGGMGASGGFGGSGGSGGAGGDTGGTGGYGVVDPLPPPFYCAAPDMFAVSVARAVWTPFGIEVVLQIADTDASDHTTVQAVTTVAGVMATTPGTSGAPLSLLLAGNGGVWPAVVEVYVGFDCRGDSGVVHYQIGIRLTTSSPASMGDVPAEIFATNLDAGVGP
jgi:hypothetical protein